MSLWHCAMEIEGGEASWRGTPWSGTSHNFPQRSPWVCCLSQAKMSTGSPSAQPASDLFSQKCGWIRSVPPAQSHWPPHPPSVYRLSDSWLRQGGHCVTIECTTLAPERGSLGLLPHLPRDPSCTFVSLAHGDGTYDTTDELRVLLLVLQVGLFVCF